MMREARFRAALAAAALLCPLAASCAGVPEFERIEVTGSRAADLLDAASEGTVTREQLENRPLLRPGEVLETVPGVIVTQHSGSGKANQLFLRGFNLDHGTDLRTTAMEVPVNLPTHAHGQGYTDLNFLIPELISAMRYRKGPYYADEGDFSAAGAVHIDYVRTLAFPIAELGAGSGNYRRFLAASSWQSAGSGGGWLAAIEALEEDGPWDVPENLRKLNAVLRWSGAAAEGFSFTAMSYRNRWRSTDQVARRAIDSGLIDRFGSLDTTDGGRTWRHSVSANWRASSPGAAVRASAYAVDYGLNLFSDFTYFLDDSLSGDQFEQADRRRVLGASAEVALASRVAALDFEHGFGVEARNDRIGTVGLYHTVGRTRIATVREDSVDQMSAAAWYRNTIRWLPWLRTTAGVRADAYRFKVASDIAENSGAAAAHIVNPKVSAVLGPFGNTELFVDAGGGFHSNDARGATIRVDPSTREPVQRVDPLVRARGLEVGLHAGLAPGWSMTLLAWRLDLASELVFAGDAGTTEPSRPSRRGGIEWSSYWRPREGLVVDADLALSRARFRDDSPAGDRIPGAIERTASVGISWTRASWSSGMRLRYFGPRPLIEDGSVRSPGSALANFRAGYRATPAIKVTFEVLNLFDRKASDVDYFYASRLKGESAPVDDIHTHPAEPRAFRAVLAVEF